MNGSTFTSNSADVRRRHRQRVRDGDGERQHLHQQLRQRRWRRHLRRDATLKVDHSTISGNTATTGGGLYVSGGSQAEIDFSTINDPNGGGIVNNGSTVHLKKTVVDGVLYNDQYYS